MPAFPAIRIVGTRRLLLSSALLLAGGMAVGTARAAELPAFLAAALARFDAGVPRGWAYAVAVTRGADSSVERFDPSRPAGLQWTLAQRNGRPPTAAEAERYRRYRETNNSVAADRATFARGDLDYSSARITHDDRNVAVIQCGFRAGTADPMLGHLEVFLQVAKEPAMVEKATLKLVAPYSPVTGLKMDALEVVTTFAPPGAGHAGLPQTTLSRFHGRILWFWPVVEETRVIYSDFHLVADTGNRAPSP